MHADVEERRAEPPAGSLQHPGSPAARTSLGTTPAMSELLVLQEVLGVLARERAGEVGMHRGLLGKLERDACVHA